MEKRTIAVFFAVLMAMSFTPNALADNDGGDVSSRMTAMNSVPSAIERVSPIYPFEAERDGLEGEVTLRFIVTKQGEVKTPSVVESSPMGMFDQSALEAIRHWRFKPAVKAGETVDAIAIMPLHFRLPESRGTGYDAYLAVNKGMVHMRSGNYERAIDEFSRAIWYFPDEPANSATYNSRGVSYVTIGRYEEAVSDFDTALNLRPDQAIVHANRGGAYARLGNLQKAIRDCNAAIELDPRMARAYADRGAAYWELGRPREALEDCSKAISLDPELIGAYYVRGNAHRKTGRYQEAVADYSQVINGRPDYAQVYNNRGYAYNNLGKIDEACADLARACELGDCRGSKLLAEQGACQ